ncbi:MAG: glycosyltransferase family 2 protein [Flavobacteriia bacterium]|jgi:biofilm PGA synthesis N-glycosyltransferase PgaC
METIHIITILSIAIVCYTYLGYPVILFLLSKMKRKEKSFDETYDLPTVSLLVAAWNEEDIMEEKIQNCYELDYPKDKIQLVFITDGSNDKTAEIVANHKNILLLHNANRNGKTAAINRAMSFITSEITVFSDANAMLNEAAIKNIVRHYSNPKVACVSGEKRVSIPEKAAASSAGEGLYWKYESKLKLWDSNLYSATGAAGELFSIRTSLFERVKEDTILDDFMISMQLVIKGYKIAYEPNAYALENGSENIQEEFKRKIRICAGAFQSMLRLLPLLNIFKYGIFTFQYVSHRVLRWTLAPLALFILFPISIIGISFDFKMYAFISFAQVIFYLFAFFGWKYEKLKTRKKLFFVPFYFIMMNYSVLAGFRKFMWGSQEHLWQKAKRIAS